MSDPFDDETTIHGEATLSRGRRHARRPGVLEQHQGPGAPCTFPLLTPRVVVGRSAQADVAVDSQLISRQHFELERAGATHRCRDLDSSNGLFLNGVRIHAAVLFDGDELQLGDVLFTYWEPGG
jgi:predicted component of type VI protein secretion system